MRFASGTARAGRPSTQNSSYPYPGSGIQSHIVFLAPGKSWFIISEITPPWQIISVTAAGSPAARQASSCCRCAATSFSKPRAEQTTTLSCGNKNLKEVVVKMIPDYDPKKRYKVTGEFDTENRVMYFDMTTAEVSLFRASDK